MTIIKTSFVLGPSSSVLTLNPPFRLAEKHRMGGGGFGMRLSERSEFSILPAHSSIAGHPQGGHVGYPFFW
ncbi:MAG: hypothetical protein WBN45_01065 [Arenicellales bacterium]